MTMPGAFFDHSAQPSAVEIDDAAAQVPGVLNATAFGIDAATGDVSRGLMLTPQRDPDPAKIA